MTKIRAWRIFLTFLVAVTCAAILSFSSQNPEDSKRTSFVFCEPLLTFILGPETDSFSLEFLEGVDSAVQYIIRKAAHFAEYAFLGGILLLLFEAYCCDRILLKSWICSFVFACLDECVQLFHARSGMWQDVLWDGFGSLCGGILAWLIVQALWLRFLRKRGYDAAMVRKPEIAGESKESLPSRSSHL